MVVPLQIRVDNYASVMRRSAVRLSVCSVRHIYSMSRGQRYYSARPREGGYICFISIQQKQVCVQLPTSARHCPHLLQARRATIDRYLLRAGPSAANLQQRYAAGESRHRRTDRQTGARPLHRPCSAYHASSANN